MSSGHARTCGSCGSRAAAAGSTGCRHRDAHAAGAFLAVGAAALAGLRHTVAVLAGIPTRAYKLSATTGLSTPALDAEALARTYGQRVGIAVAIVVEAVANLIRPAACANAFDHPVDTMVDAWLALSFVGSARAATAGILFVNEAVAIVVETVALLGDFPGAAAAFEFTRNALDDTWGADANVRATRAAGVHGVFVGLTVAVVILGVANFELLA
jgi:hypothetical protein